MPDPHSFEKLRPLGRLEKYSSFRHGKGYYNNVGLTAAYTTATSSIPLKPLIYAAISTVIGRHPSLSAIIVDETSEAPSFVRLPSIDLREAVSFMTLPASKYSESEISEVLEKQHSSGYHERYGELPFWRLAIVLEEDSNSKFTAAFIFHHSIADGTSGLIFHRSFHAALCSLSSSKVALTEESVNPIVECPETPMLPSLEESHPLPLTLWFILKALWNEYFASGPQGLWSALPPTTSPEFRHARVRVLSLPPSVTANIVRVSRENKTTLTGTAEAALAAVMFAHLPDEYKQLYGSDAVSFRRWLPKERHYDDELGVWVTRCLQLHQRPGLVGSTKDSMQLFSWDHARQVRANLEAELKKDGKDSAPALLRFVPSYADFFQKRIGKPRDVSFEFSNVGRFVPAKMEQSDMTWSVGAVWFSQSPDICGAPILTSVATGGDGGINFSFSWLDGIVESAWMEKVIEDYSNVLHEISKFSS